MKALALAALVAAGVVAAFPPSAATRGATTTTWTDPSGDGGSGPDLTALTISDSSSGLLQFAFTVTNMAPYSGIYVFLDTDRNDATGSGGSEYALALECDGDGSRWYDVVHWTGATWVEVPESTSMGMSVSGSSWTLRIGARDLGSPAAFAFYAHAGLTDETGETIVASDWLPDDGSLLYELSGAPPPTTTGPVAAALPWIGGPTVSPAPTAGAKVTVAFPVTDRTTGAPLTHGTMTCDPRLNGRVLPHQESFGNGAATLRFTLPKTAKGKTLKVSLTIRVGSKSAHRVATYRVK